MPHTREKVTAQRRMCPERAVCAFQDTVQPCLDRIDGNFHEASAIAGMRDLPLPGLMSGEFGLRKAEMVLETVTQ
jgi:hypothetical protein